MTIIKVNVTSKSAVAVDRVLFLLLLLLLLIFVKLLCFKS